MLQLYRLLFVFFVLIDFGLYSLQAQVKENYPFQHIRNGIPQNSATVIFEDSYGFLWIGTPNGVNKYNGTDFELFNKTQNSTANDYVYAICEVQSNLYIGTNNGLHLYNREINRISPVEFKGDAKILEVKNYRTLAQTDSLLWLGSYSHGLFKYNIETGAVKQFLVKEKLLMKKETDNLISKVVPLSGNRLLAVASAKVFVLDWEFNVLSALDSDEFLNVAFKASDEHILIGTKEGSLLQLHVKPNSEMQLSKKSISPGFPILAVATYPDNTIWMGTENDGLYVYYSQTDALKQFKLNPSSPSSISNNSIWSLLKAQNNVMWMAPYKKGLSFYDPKFYKFKNMTSLSSIPNSTDSWPINCFSEDAEGNLWIGTDGGGLNYWNRDTDSFASYSLDTGNFGSNIILSLLQVNKDELWAGTWSNGLVIFDPNRKTYENWNTKNSFLLSNNISDLFRDSKGRIWISNFFGGVQVYDPKTRKHQNVVLRSDFDNAVINTVLKIIEDANGNMWIGTQTWGVLRLQEKENGWSTSHYYTNGEKRKISNDFVNDIVQDVSGTIWVATNSGLNKYDKELDTFSLIPTSAKLSNNSVKAIVDDTKGNLWLSTDVGITKYNTLTSKTEYYTEKDGLQESEFNAAASFVTNSGEYIFGGINGYNIFKPENIKKSTDAPEIFITELRVFNTPVLPNDDFGILKKDIRVVDSIQLNYDDSVINFRFNALTFRHPEAVQYAYFLEGFETDWKYTGNNSYATYTNLNPGKYTLRIKSTNSDGVWGANEKQLYVYVKPPFWSTTWFRLLVASLLLLTIYFGYFLKLRRAKNRQQNLEWLVVERTAELEYQKDKLMELADQLAVKNEEIQRFAFAVSHDLKGPLNNIKTIIDLIPNEVAMNTAPNLKEYLRLIDVCYDLMHNLISDITKIAKLGKIENNNELLDTNEIIELASAMISEKLDTQNVKLQIEDSLPVIYGDRNRMVQVFSNFLDNAVKYMGNQAKPEIHISSESKDDFNSFLIKDNGSGMNEEALDKIFTPFERFHSNVKGTGLGLYMIQQIAISHGGQIKVTSDGEGKGATFELMLPNAHRLKEKMLKNQKIEHGA